MSAVFVLNSDITIGNFRFTGVNDIVIKKSIHNLAQTAIIKIPSLGAILNKNKDLEKVSTSTLFKDGDKVIINLAYNQPVNPTASKTPIVSNGNNGFNTEFIGFVKRRNMGYPMVIECEGYIRPLRLKANLKKFFKKTTVGEVLKYVCDSCGLPAPIIANDTDLINVNINNADGATVIKKLIDLCQGAINIFFIQPDILWCGLIYTPYVQNKKPFTGDVNYRIGFNCLRDNQLKQRVTEGEPVQVIFNGQMPNGDIIGIKSIDIQPKSELTVVNNIPNKNQLQKLANEKQYQMNFQGFEGNITGLLQPYCEIGWLINVTDNIFKERNGSYLCTGIEIQFGLNGAKRKVELGCQLGFKSK